MLPIVGGDSRLTKAILLPPFSPCPFGSRVVRRFPLTCVVLMILVIMAYSFTRISARRGCSSS